MPELLDSSLKRAVKGTTLLFIGGVGSMAIWFAARVLVVRSTTMEEFGLYTLVITVAAVLSGLALLGIPEGVARHVATFMGKGRREDAEAISRASLHMGLISSLAAFVLLYLLSDVLALHVFYRPDIAAPLRVVSFFIPFSVMAVVLTSILRGHGIIRPRVYYLDIGQPLYFLFFLAALFFFGFTPVNIVYAFTLSMAMVFICISGHGYRAAQLSPVPLRRGRYYGRLLRFSLPLLIFGFSAMVLNWTDILMLGRYSTPEDVGVYNVSISLARLLLFILNAFGFMFLPLAGEMHGRGESAELKRMYQVLTKWIFSATLPLFFVLFFFPEMTITFLFGERLLEAAPALSVLSIGFLFQVFLGANGMLLLVLGMTMGLMKISLSGAFLNVVLNYILIKRLGYGVMGAAMATVVSYFAINVFTSLLLYRRSGIHPFTARYIKPVLGSLVVGLALYAVAKSLPLYFWMMPLYFVVFVAGYLFFQLVTRSLDREDIALFEAISKKTGLRMDILRKIMDMFDGSGRKK